MHSVRAHRRTPLTFTASLPAGARHPPLALRAFRPVRVTPARIAAPRRRYGAVRATLPKDPTTSPPPTPAQPPPETGDAGGAPSANSNLKKDTLVTLGWIGVAGATALGVAKWKGSEAALQFITAYIVEYALSVDNLFVFLLIFSYFQVPRTSQTRVLSFGIAGAVLFRLVMIVAGEALTQRFRAVTLAFAAVLLFSAGKLLLGDDEEEEDVSKSPIVKFARSLLPFSDAYDGDRFFTRAADGGRMATPLMLVLLSVELSDVVFALDSVPAVLGVSDDALVIYASNVLAVAGLRNLFFVLADSIGGLRYLPKALAVVLGFVGGKMVAGVAGYDIGVAQSLGIVVGALALGIGLSVALPEGEEAAEGEAGESGDDG